MENNDRSEYIEKIIKYALNSTYMGEPKVAGTLNEVMDNEYPRGAGVGIQFADGSQYKISIERIK